jgi:dihydroneopterin aldolase
MVKILVRELVVSTLIGVYPEERLAHQQLVLDLTLDCDVDASLRSDVLADTIDYAALSADLTAWGATATFELIETFAGHAMQRILAYDSRIQTVTLRVVKAGCIANAKAAEVVVSGIQKN